MICGILIGSAADGKALVLRSFFYLCAVCVLLQAAAIRIRWNSRRNAKAPAEAGNTSSRFSVSDLLKRSQVWEKIKTKSWFSCRWSSVSPGNLTRHVVIIGRVKYCKISEWHFPILQLFSSHRSLCGWNDRELSGKNRRILHCSPGSVFASVSYHDSGSSSANRSARLLCSVMVLNAPRVCRCTLYDTDSL